MKRSKLMSLLLSGTMVLSLVGAPAAAAGKEPVKFGDMEGHWSTEAVDRWSADGIFQGDENGNFLPDKEMTRAEFAQMLVNLMGYTEKAGTGFADVPADAWYADAISKLAAAGVMEGDGTNAMPTVPISREQAAVLLCRALYLEPGEKDGIHFEDAYQVSSWARDAVAALAQRDMIQGVGENHFAPALNINRSSVAQMVHNMVSAYVTEDGAAVTGEQKGVVIIAAKDVTVKDGALAESLILAPKAAGATVTLAGKTTAARVVLAAEGGKAAVGKDVTVARIAVEAPKAELAVSGKVERVTVAASASEAVLTVEKDGVITHVETAADKVSVKGPGKIGTLTVTGGQGVTVDKETKVEKVVNRSKFSVTVGNKEVKPGASLGGDSASGGSGGGSDTDPDRITVTYQIGNDTKTYTVDKDADVFLPEIDTEDEDYYYTGKWTYRLEGDTAVYEALPGETIRKVTADLTLTAQGYPVENVSPAGLAYTGTPDTMMVEVKNNSELVMHTYGVEGDIRLLDLTMTYTKPAKAAKLAVADSVRELYGAGLTADTTGLTVSVDSGEARTITKYLLWADENDNILAVQKVTVKITVDNTAPNAS